MRKILIIVLIIIMLAGLGILVTSGVTLGKVEIASVQKIIYDNKNLDAKIAELDTSIKTTYSSAKSNLEESITNLQASKQKYQDTINYSTEEEIKAANQNEKYELSYLWTKIGLYATKKNVTIKADLSSGTVEDLYNISFTATGEYLSISEFIYAIENDSELGFKIENFTLVPYSEDSLLQATFIIRNVAIDKTSITQVTEAAGSGTESTSDANQNTVAE